MLKSNRNLKGEVCAWVKESWRADRASARCALEGGLKEESRMKRVLGDEGGLLGKGLMVWTTRKVDLEDWNDFRADSSFGSMACMVLLEVAIGADVIVVFVRDWKQRQ